MKTPIEILRHYWHYDAFRPLQEEIINSVMNGNDTLALLPTGGGKSICYQIPAVAMGGLCIVVSPLIALMKDQVTALNAKRIKAACLYSGLKYNEQTTVLNNCIYGGIKLLYVSPERLQSRTFIEHFKQMPVKLIAVDEAHCISQWGHDFRPSYRKIADIRQYFPQVPILALTATATTEVVKDICKQLQFQKDSNKFQSSFYRSNLSYMVLHDEDKLGRMLRILRKINGCGIVYVESRKTANEVASFLRNNGISASFYHAGLDTKTRDNRQKAWMKGEFSVMVATTAFGMGIDKKDVRIVIHYTLPTCIESYFQEAGRAGRDGKRSYAVILHNQRDIQNMDSILDISYPPLSVIRNVYRAIGNEFNIPIGSGEGCTYDFDILDFSKKYKFNILTIYNSIQFLQKEGLLDLQYQEELSSRLYIPIDRNELYRFIVENKRYGDLLNVIIRTYGGLYTEYVPINERRLAAALNCEVSTIIKMLLHLDALEIVVYKPIKEAPQIVLLSPRIDAKDLYISEEYYGNLKAKAQNRLSAMKEYVLSDTKCRSNILLEYFGEQNHEVCHTCDICLEKENPTRRTFHTDILNILSRQPRNIRELADAIAKEMNLENCQDEIAKNVREMLELGILGQNSDFTLYIKKQSKS